MSFIYIASPYTDPSPIVMQNRYKQVSYYMVGLLGQRKWCYSPISALHNLALEFNLAPDINQWLPQNFAMLSEASELQVLMLDGWNKSLGVTAEVAFWRGARADLPLRFVDFDPIGKTIEE